MTILVGKVARRLNADDYGLFISRMLLFLQKEDFPLGFYLVFVVHSDDTQCTKDARLIQKNKVVPRFKTVTFIVHEKITDVEYIVAIFGTFGIFFTFYVFAFLISCCYMFK